MRELISSLLDPHMPPPQRVPAVMPLASPTNPATTSTNKLHTQPSTHHTSHPSPHLSIKRFRIIKSPSVPVELRQVVQGAGDVWVVGGEACPCLHQGFLEATLSLRVPTGVVRGGGECAQTYVSAVCCQCRTRKASRRENDVCVGAIRWAGSHRLLGGGCWIGWGGVPLTQPTRP